MLVDPLVDDGVGMHGDANEGGEMHGAAKIDGVRLHGAAKNDGVCLAVHDYFDGRPHVNLCLQNYF